MANPADLVAADLRFAAQAQRTPEACAARFGSDTLSYQELDRRSNRLAGLLAARGVVPGDRVGVAVDRGLELALAVLGVLRVGAAYVPLDPDYPKARLEFMAQDSGAELILVSQAHANLFKGIAGLLVIEEILKDLKDGPDELPDVDRSLEDPAYLIYTSGSTGKPKGVVMPHQALANLVDWELEQPGLNVPARTLQFSSLSFDAHFQEMFSTWAAGGEIVFLEDRVRRDALSFARFMADAEIERLYIPFVGLQQLADVAVNIGPLPTSLKHVMTAGEQLLANRIIRDFFSRLPECKLHNYYGPSETHVVTAHTLTGDPAGWPELPPIGKPIANTEILLLDDDLEPVETGEIGELCVAGLSLADGYWNRPEATAERFLPQIAGQDRVYRTGDLARLDSDGALEFLGRVDDQIKIRGYRIEAGEIETAISEEPTVRECAVIAAGTGATEKRLVAYVVFQGRADTDAAGDADGSDSGEALLSLRKKLEASLPEYMVPSRFVAIEELPRTPSGKLARNALPEPTRERPQLDQEFVRPKGDAEKALASLWAELLELDEVGANDSFFELGGTSLLTVRLSLLLREKYGRDVPVVALFQYPTLRTLAKALESEMTGAGEVLGQDRASLSPSGPFESGEGDASSVPEDREGPWKSGFGDTRQGVAVIGLAGRFPGARDVQALWELLKAGKDAITFFSDEELRESGIDEETLGDPSYVKAKSILEDPEGFDAAFFGISPREALLMDPQHRLFLEVCWEALENAGYAPGSVPGAVGVWGGDSAGMTYNTYLVSNLLSSREELDLLVSPAAMLGNESDYLTTRVSYKLGLTGPSINVQTACSTSLVAIAQAFQSLATGGCDMALAGGVSVSFPQQEGYLHQEEAITSPDGRCRPFDAEAGGTVFGDGVGVVVLKRLDKALEDGDQVLAVIRGVALNNDGSEKVSFAAPSVDGQAAVIQRAQENAGVSPDSITYVETHGTGTPLGDPIEVAGLTQAFRKGTERNGFCALGSVKSNVGHLISAAGVTGFIKAVLCLKHQTLVPTAHYSAPNPRIDFSRTPFFVNAEYRPWHVDGMPRRAGVSGFGLGGTNAHVILEEAPELDGSAGLDGSDRLDSPEQVGSGPVDDATRAEEPPQLLVLSAKAEAALEKGRVALGEFLAAEGAPRLEDVAFTLQSGREAFSHRLAYVTQEGAEAASVLQAGEGEGLVVDRTLPSGGSTVFLFPGGGAQYVQMARGLYENDELIRKEIDLGMGLMRELEGVDLAPVWFPDPEGEEEAAAEFQRPSIQLPAIFILEMALARRWQAWGIQPDALLGHSLGENTAACLAGVLSYEDALRLVTLRGRLFETVPAGGMLSVACDEGTLAPLLADDLDIAAVNAPSQITVSGPTEALKELEGQLEGEGVECQVVPITIAAHSRMVESILPEWAAFLGSIQLNPPEIPIVSNRTGGWLSDEEATDPGYWTEHLRHPVRFSEGVSCLMEEEDRVFLEVGPGKILGSLVRLHAPQSSNRIIPSLRHPREEVPDHLFLLRSLGRSWCLGGSVDWVGVRGRRGFKRVALPTYAFQSTRLLVEAGAGGGKGPQPAHATSPAGDSGRAPGIAVPLPAVSEQLHGGSSHLPGASISEEPMTSVPVDRKDFILQRLRQILTELSGLPEADLDIHSSFIEMGFDSLFLTQAALKFKRAFSVKVTFRQLFNEAPCLDALAGYIDGELSDDALKEEMARAAAPPAPPAGLPGLPAVTGVPGGDAVQQVLALQMQATAALNALLAGGSIPGIQASATAGGVVGPGPSASADPTGPENAEGGEEPAGQPTAAMGPYKPMQKELLEPVREELEGYIQEFMAAYQARTPKSKALTAQNRSHFADPRAVSGFKLAYKEMIYPLIGERSKGSRVWDIDGNEYIDCVGGFGAIFFGHAPDFVMEEVRRQTEITVDYGPGSIMAADTAKMVCEFTGMDRATFCNTGSEAVLATMRMARTVTGRDLIATFSGDYHGIFDEVLVKSQKIGGTRRNQPVAPGIPNSANQQMLVLDYGDPASLKILEERADELAAVLIEPIQSRTPELQPREFLHEVRRITLETGVPMIFDEVITGFRLAPGGAQEWYGVEADIAAYGKVIGGGMPIGVVAGKAEYMDALDGGMWEYGDDSFPEAGVTYFAGTFVRHPLAIAAVHRILKYLKEEGPALQEKMNRKTAWFAEETNRAYRRLGIPVELVYFGSVFLPRYRGHPDYEGLFAAHLRQCGIHIWEGRPGFLTTAHTQEDMQGLVDGFVEAGTQMKNAGFFPGVEYQGEATAESSRRSDEEVGPGQDFDFTAAQRELWLAFRMGEDAAAAFNEQILFEIDGAVDPVFLELAFDKAVNRFDSLRAVVRRDQEGLRVLPYIRPQFVFEDLSEVSSEEEEVRTPELARKHIDDPFDFYGGPLVRLLLVRKDENRHLLGLCVSHLICDGWSTEIVIQAIAQYYTAMIQGRQVDLGENPPLAEFLALEREKEEEGALSEEMAFWKEEFSEPLPPNLDLPTDRRRPPMKSYRGERRFFQLDTQVVDQLRAYARSQGSTMFTLLLAAYNALLHRITGTEDLVVGVPAAGQPNVGMPNLVVHSVNFLPLRNRVTPDLTFQTLLQRARDGFNDCKTYQDYSYGRLVQDLRLPRDPSRPPLVSVGFNVDLEFAPILFEETEARFVTTPRSYVKYDLLFNFIDKGVGLDLEVDYNADLMEGARAEEWLRYYENILTEIASDPEALVGDLPLHGGPTTTEGTDQAGEVRVYSQEQALHDRFSSQALVRPEDVAVSDSETSLRYRELDSLSDRIAWGLREAGIEHGDRVGLYLGRSCQTVAAILGVLKAGGCFVPMEPGHPEARMNFMLEDAELSAVLVDEETADSFKGVSGPEVLPVASLVSVPAPPEESWKAQVSVDASAYIIYTSGSTGEPKGVEVTHRNVLRLFDATDDWFQFNSEDVWSVFHSYAFDFSVWEIWGGLLYGGRIVVVSYETSRTPRDFRNLLAREGVTVLNQTPSAFQQLARVEREMDDKIPLRYVVFGGEALDFSTLDSWVRKYGDSDPVLVNMYGITETTVHVTYRRIREEDVSGAQGSLIGEALPDLELYILDEEGKQVVPGRAGELYVGGGGVAKGYFNRPELTPQRFISNPFGEGRLYRTGDSVCLRHDGELEYRGRLDGQVQIRGFRVELGEIEALLLSWGPLSEVVVHVHEPEQGEQTLLAFGVPEGDVDPTGTEMRRHLRNHLPDYMIPQHLVLMAEFPLTPNGKLDRERLPVPGLFAQEEQVSPPNTPGEKYLAALWTELLGIEGIGLEDNFFDLGGHSLLAVRAAARIEEERGVEIPLPAFLLHDLGSIAADHLSSLDDAGPGS